MSKHKKAVQPFEIDMVVNDTFLIGSYPDLAHLSSIEKKAI